MVEQESKVTLLEAIYGMPQVVVDLHLQVPQELNLEQMELVVPLLLELVLHSIHFRMLSMVLVLVVVVGIRDNLVAQEQVMVVMVS
jgi:hypothetical protein